MQTIDCDVAIVGAGPAGATLACLLRHSGLRVVVLDKVARTPAIGRGDHLAPCTGKMLDGIGALKNLRRRGATEVRRWKALGPERETLTDITIDVVSEAPYDFITSLPHPLIREALRDTAIESDAVRWLFGYLVTELIRDARGQVCGLLGQHDDEPFTINARLVAGCDGMRSTVRELAGIATELETMPDEFVMMTCTRGRSMPEACNIEMWGANGFVGYFPLPDDKVRCPVQVEAGELSRWRRAGMRTAHEFLIRNYPYFDEMQFLDEGLHVYKVIQHHAERYVDDGVALLGDAAHCTTPFFGMGMTMGMRDAYHLSHLIQELFRHDQRASRANLAAYEARCRTYNQFVIHASANLCQVGASRLKTSIEVQQAMLNHTALDPDVMEVIYSDYDAAPPAHAEPRRVSRYVASLAQAQRLACEVMLGGLGFPESPRWHGGSLWFVDFLSGRVCTMDEAGALSTRVSIEGTPSGLGFLADGSVLVGAQQRFKILRVAADGAVREHADLGRYARGGANDMVVDGRGNAYVGHFGFDFFGGGVPKKASILFVSAAGEVREVAHDIVFPNGMVITPDGKTLIVAETFRGELTAFDIQDDGGLTNRRVWAEVPGYTPDGLCLDESGAIWAGNPLAMAFIRVEEGGRITHRIPVTGKWAIACALGGADSRTLYCLTAETSLADMPRGISKGYIETVRVDIPGV